MRDLIDRQAALDALAHDWDGMVTSVFDVIKQLPSASQWIPCNERLPGVYADVLCCNAYGEYIIGMPYADGDSNTGFCVDNDGEYMIDCVAWMSLPEPYKGGQNG